MIAAPREGEPEGLVLGPPGSRVRPHAGEVLLARGAVDGIELRHVLVTDHHLAVVLEPHLPERGVADEERRVPARIDELVHDVALLPAPVLVVAGRRQQAVPLHDAGVAVEVALHAVVDLVAVRLQPRHEDRLPRLEAGEARPVVVALLDLARGRIEHRALAEAWNARVDVADRARRPAQEAPLPGALEREPARDGPIVARVEALPAPGVVRGVGVRREDHQDSGGALRGRRPHHEEVVPLEGLTLPVLGPERHRVVAGPPVPRDPEAEAVRPAAAPAVGLGRRRVKRARNATLRPHDVARGADPRDLDGVARRRGRRMEPHLVARLIAQPVRVAAEAAVPGARQAILIRPDQLDDEGKPPGRGHVGHGVGRRPLGEQGLRARIESGLRHGVGSSVRGQRSGRPAAPSRRRRVRCSRPARALSRRRRAPGRAAAHPHFLGDRAPGPLVDPCDLCRDHGRR